jgi:hypothetical protein
VKDLDDFNKLEERAWQLTGQLEDETLERKPLPEKCKLCRKSKSEIHCEVCILDDYL